MTRNRLRRISLAVLPALVSVGLGCAGTGINKGDFNLISVGQEWQLGDKLSRDIEAKVHLVETPEINAFLTRMGQTILEQARGDTPVASRPWHFHVIAENQVNAFNIPGGHVYLYSGLIERTGNYAELMGVLAHEISHGLARHGVENLSKQYGISAVASLVLGKDPTMYEQVLANVLAGGAIMKFSRNAEREADRLGAGYMYGAGVNPQGMADFFGKLLKLRPKKPSGIEQFFASHPLTEERIQNTQELIRKLPPKPLTMTDPGFPGFRRAVLAAAGS